MDDFRLRVFIAAAKSLSFTRCAEQLYISQPAVSKHIGELESRYKAQLFERHGSRLVLTDAGRTLLAYAERITDEYRKLQYEMSLKPTARAAACGSEPAAPSPNTSFRACWRGSPSASPTCGFP